MSADPFTAEADTFPAAVLGSQSKERAGTSVLGRRPPEPPPFHGKGTTWPLATTLPASDAELNTLIGRLYSDFNSSINRTNFYLDP